MAPYQMPGAPTSRQGGNANSLHSPGRVAFEAMERARKEVARCVGARRPDEIVFTSGATEADDAVLFGVSSAERDRRRRAGSGRLHAACHRERDRARRGPPSRERWRGRVFA